MFNIPTLNEFISSLQILDYFLFLVNIALFLLANKIVTYLNNNKNKNVLKKKVRNLRIANLILFFSFFLAAFIDHNTFQPIIQTGIAFLGIFYLWEIAVYKIERTYAYEEDEHGN